MAAGEDGDKRGRGAEGESWRGLWAGRTGCTVEHSERLRGSPAPGLVAERMGVTPQEGPGEDMGSDFRVRRA